VGGNESHRAAEASECANELGEFWNYHKMMFANQAGEGKGAFSDRRLKAFAETLGLNTQAFNQCFDSGRYAQNVLADEGLARSMGVTGTPTIFVNGRLAEGAGNYDVLRQAIEMALGGR
jgi:protein-disulfide isomerase